MQTRDRLNLLAANAGVSMQQIIDQALELYRRQQLMQQTNLAYAQLREDAAAWDELETDRAAWDTTLNDGLPEV
jgi:hypothetical protein